jgi:branched-chain amino acid transport system substrate-binding protein
MRRGAELAVAEINGSGGVLDRRLELLPLDDLGQPETAAQMARRYRDNHEVLAVIGHAHSPTTFAAAPIYNSGTDPIVVISPSAFSPSLATAGPNVFTVCPDDVAHAKALAEWSRERQGQRRAAILYHNDPDSRATAAAFRREFTEGGGMLLSEDPFSTALPSFEPYLTRARNRGRVDALLVTGGGTSIGTILTAADSVGIYPTILGNIDLLRHAHATGIDLDGAALSTPYVPARGSGDNEAFVTAYRQANGGQQPDHIAAGSYDVVYLIAHAIAGDGPTRAGIRSYLAGVGSETEPFEGVTGPIAFDEDGKLERTSVEIGTVRDGVLVPSPERRP